MPDGLTVLTIPQAAQYLHIGITTLYVYCRQGRIPAVKVGRQWRLHREALDGLLRGGVRASDATAPQT